MNGQSNEQFVSPVATVLENPESYTLQVEMPGVSKEGLEMWVENNELTIVGRRSQPAVTGTVLHRESRRDNFRRAFELDPLDRRQQGHGENRSRTRHLDAAKSGAGQATQDHGFVEFRGLAMDERAVTEEGGGSLLLSEIFSPARGPFVNQNLRQLLNTPPCNPVPHHEP
ncbi:MAG: Hsp20/alpha crystallin family protein [Chthoniobacterales bacterium]